MPPRSLAPPYDLEAAAAHLAARDRRLGALIARVGPCTLAIHSGLSPYAALAAAIVSQQLHGRAAAAIWGRLCAHFGRRTAPPPARLRATSIETLRSVGLSRAKALALLDLAAQAGARRLPTRAAAARLSDEALSERLTAVRGIGVWTVEMLLIFTLGRPDVMPATDLGVRRGYARTFGGGELPSPATIARRAERWRPFRSVAAWYLWRAAEAKS